MGWRFFSHHKMTDWTWDVLWKVILQFGGLFRWKNLRMFTYVKSVWQFIDNVVTDECLRSISFRRWSVEAKKLRFLLLLGFGPAFLRQQNWEFLRKRWLTFWAVGPLCKIAVTIYCCKCILTTVRTCNRQGTSIDTTDVLLAFEASRGIWNADFNVDRYCSHLTLLIWGHL